MEDNREDTFKITAEATPLRNASESIGKLAMALSKAQGEMKDAEKKSKNPFFGSMYADLNSVFEAIRPALSKNGIAVTQIIIPDPNFATVETLLIHESGEWLKSKITMKPSRYRKDGTCEERLDPQGFGSAYTYARRYALSAIVGIASEADDDGNNASGQDKKGPPQKAKKAPLVKPQENRLTDAQKKKMWACFNEGFGDAPLNKDEKTLITYDFAGRVLGKDVQSIAGLSKEEASKVIDIMTKDPKTIKNTVNVFIEKRDGGK